MLKTFTLKNGIKVATYNLPQVKSVYLQQTIKGGSILENSENNGVAHFMEHILVEGIPSYPTSELLSEYIEGLAGTFNAVTSPTSINFHVSVPSAHLQSALKIGSEVFFEPLFSQDGIAKERYAILSEINQRMEQPWFKVDQFFKQIRYKDGHPLILYTGGTVEIVEKLTREDLVNFWQQHFSPSNTYILIVGNLSKYNIKKLVAEYFGKFPKKFFPTFPKLTHSDFSDRQVAIRADDNLQTVYLDLTIPSMINLLSDDKLRISQSILLNVFGGLLSSRLYRLLRSQRGLVYYVRAGSMMLPGLGFVNISSQVIPQNLDEVLTLIVQEFLKFIKDGPTTQEFDFVKNFLINQWSMVFDNPGSIANWVQGELFWEKKIRLPDDLIKIVKKLSLRDSKQLMQKNWDFAKLNLVLQGPIEESDDNIKKYSKMVEVLDG